MSRGWTAADITDQSGRRAVVTGATSGLGFHTALELARHGADVVLAVRDPQRGSGTAGDIEQQAPGAAVSVRRLDLADLASVRSFADGWDGSLDLLVNNAGVMAIPHRRTADGVAMQLGTNHLGHFALTGLLLPSLLAAAAPRVVTVSSTAHRAGRIDFDDLQSERRYGRWEAYNRSKLANLLFAFELQRRIAAAGLPMRSVAAHPGYAATNLQATGPRMSGRRIQGLLMSLGNRVLAQSASRGALPQLYAATMPDVRGGEYFGPDGLMEGRGSPKRVSATRAANDPDTARRLWEVSENLTGVRFDMS